MATAEQIKSLLQSHYKNDNERFTSIALQLAAHEARQGHLTIAKDIKALVDRSKTDGFKVIRINPDLSDLVLVYYPENKLSELILSNDVNGKLQRIIKEYKQRDKIQKFGLQNRRKILLSGLPGTGKTATASAISGELKIPLYVIMMDKLMTKYMGETASKLRQIFDMMISNRGVYLFDEFDAIGAERGRDNEVGEMRRVLNSFLQFIEQDSSESIIFGATNNIRILDSALFRRFDDIINYNLPDKNDIEELIKLKLSKYLGNFSLENVIAAASGLSHAEITNACHDALKEIILTDKNTVTQKLLIEMIKDRKINFNL
ncbi:ATP-binding protein [Flavobacterium sp. 17A]|uniref:ATP-binding protein n=2 Tax=Flavobacterium TaxID=237 RepID=A0A9X1KRK8_9FLAO|nr:MULTISPECIES: ATP-binding protein [Flavobacterium]AOC96943.1 ATP-dependent zinc metalloprotease FtsH 2 [Flavobacterium anhuiense]MBZ4035346.1 ATP-binding protein [Flavobacterium potami]